ncbi:MAG TPA: ferritin-like protein [Solirubrobacteraceae bacterium]|nr:ferritin-like protein [Solirubrobacteraceae bacterium]
MLYLPRQPLETVEDLRFALGNAIGLELGTIPPYLTALYSIKPGANAAAGAIIRSVVIEEMLHLSLACNLLNAVGGRPQLPGAVLRYPSELPMGIGDKPGRRFIVPLARLSQAAIEIFMTIEEPEHALVFPDEAPEATAGAVYHTIGEFYTAVGQLVADLGGAIFTGSSQRQVTGWIGPHLLHPIGGPTAALEAIATIIDQGEGTSTSPASDPETLAHYYRFEQIQRQETLNPDPAAPDGYEWGQPVVGLADHGVWPMIENPPLVPLPEGSPVSRASDQFDATFTSLINELQRTFDGAPDVLGSALAQMHALRLEAQGLMPLDVPGTAGTAGPRFLYLDRVPSRAER